MAVNSPPVDTLSLLVPPVEEVARVLSDGLKQNFAEASVTVADCPDLTEKPWNLAAPGLGGSTRILDVGGLPWLLSLRKKFYDLGQMAALAELPGAFILGAAAVSSRVRGTNGEMVPNAVTPTGSSAGLNQSYSVIVNEQDGSAILEEYSSLESGPIANVLACEGKPGKVLEIKVKHRTGEENFVSSMRKALEAHYGENPVALGGVFCLVTGKAKIHVMPAFSEKPLKTDQDVKQWLHLYDVSAPMICPSVYVSHDPGMNIRVEHTHCFSDHGEGGHYMFDISPEEVEYHAYYTLAEKLYRIDMPDEKHPSRHCSVL